MKRLSDIIRSLEQRKKEAGDLLVKEFLISDEECISTFNMVSPTRRGKHGNRLKMNNKEFNEWVAKFKKAEGILNAK